MIFHTESLTDLKKGEKYGEKKTKCVDSFEIESYVSIDGLLEFRVQHRTD